MDRPDQPGRACTVESDPWPTQAQARWWAKISALVNWPPQRVIKVARYAAAVSEAEQRQIADALMLYASNPKTPEHEVLRDQATIGGTAYAELPQDEPMPTYGGLAIPEDQ